MKTTAPVSTAAASGGVVGALVVIATWALGLAKIDVPPEVAAAAMVIIAPIVHALALRWGLSFATPDETPPEQAPKQ